MSLLLCDLDHFKKINDDYGHLAGDEVLEQVAQRLLNAVRSSDYVGRYGGEEFLIVLNGCTGSELKERAEQIRNSINCLPCVTSHGTIPISLSIGAITLEAWDRLLPLEPFLKEIDAALYRAKALGGTEWFSRNCQFPFEYRKRPVALNVSFGKYTRLENKWTQSSTLQIRASLGGIWTRKTKSLAFARLQIVLWMFSETKSWRRVGDSAFALKKPNKRRGSSNSARKLSEFGY